MKSISALLRGITSTHNGDFYCLNCFHSYRTHEKLKKHEKLCEDNDFCSLKLPNGDNKYISSTSGKNTLKIPFIIYAGLECFLFKMDSCENQSISSYTEKEALLIPCGYSILTYYSFDKTKNEHIYYRGEDCMQKFSKDLRSIFNKLINYKQKAMIPLTDNEKVLHDSPKLCFFM